MLTIFDTFCCLIIFSKSFFNSFRNTVRVSNSLDPDQVGFSFRPDLGTKLFVKGCQQMTLIGKELRGVLIKLYQISLIL